MISGDRCSVVVAAVDDDENDDNDDDDVDVDVDVDVYQRLCPTTAIFIHHLSYSQTIQLTSCHHHIGVLVYCHISSTPNIHPPCCQVIRLVDSSNSCRLAIELQSPKPSDKLTYQAIPSSRLYQCEDALQISIDLSRLIYICIDRRVMK
ncbi:hypothetical protein KSF78_0006332 [Schistosoma japonicum]|nr:hypothetical protein KSF78_0006332 [Schistosoma japonicum]